MTEPATPAAQGLRWPAEWEPHAGTWFTWPHNPETWPNRLAGAARAFAEMTRALQGREIVNVVVADEPAEARARAQLAAAGVDADRGVLFRRIPTDDGWMRDCGPLIVVGNGRRAGVDFRFNAWGGKYPPFELDDAAGAAVCASLGLPVFRSELVLEGGSIDGDGRGTLLTTEQCLLHPNRGRRTRAELERALSDLLGAREVLWLAGGIEGDDTDGHVDDIARFAAPGVVVAVAEPDAADANAAPLAENLRRLRGLRDADGKPLAVVELPMPPPLFAEGLRCPASYANFYVANGVVLVPVFGVPADARALAILRELFPGRDVLGIRCEDLVVGLGALHCVTQQEPAAAPAETSCPLRI